jgi:hypothetical protein
MDPEGPNMEQLFAPLDPSAAFGVVLREAHEVLPEIKEAADAELWGSDMIGALTRSAADGTDVMAALTDSLVPAAEEAGTPGALALLRVFAAIGAPGLAAAATGAAGRLAARGVTDPGWATAVGSPDVGQCWHYGDVGGQQESVTMSFSYGQAQHALSVLIDHGRGGQIRDAWVGEAAGLLDQTWLAAETDPMVVFEQIKPADARERLERAIGAGECPEKPDQIDDVTAHRALLHARMRFLAGQAPLVRE